MYRCKHPVMLISCENEKLDKNIIVIHIYSISIFYVTKCGMAHTFSLILIITSYLHSQMGFAAWQLNILLSLED